MTTLTSLKNQLTNIQAMHGDPNACGYAIRMIYSNESYNGTLHKTPDDALKWCYDDAHKRRLPYIKLYIWCALRFEIGNSTGNKLCGFSAARSDLRMIIHKDVHNNLVWCMDDTGIHGRYANPDCLCYPENKPEYEMLDFIRSKDLEWHNDVPHKTIEQYELEKDYPSATRDLEDYYAIVTGKRPPNSLPESHHTNELLNHYDFSSVINLVNLKR